MKEKILLVGSAGTGKSYDWLKVAETRPQETFYCIDTDDSAERMLNTEFSHLRNVEVYPAFDWMGCKNALALIEKKNIVNSDNWLVIDMLCSMWDYVQAFYVEQTFGEGIDEYFLHVRKALKKADSSLDALEGWKDWSVINKMYQKFINRIALILQCNLFFTAKGVPVEKKTSSDIKNLFGAIGIRPEGEKRNIHRVHTVIVKKQISGESWLATTVKDRGRERWEDQPIVNFGVQYGAIAGW